MDDNKPKEIIIVSAEVKETIMGDSYIMYNLATLELIDRIRKDPSLKHLCLIRRQDEIFPNKEELLRSL